MTYTIVPPPKELTNLVRHYWFVDQISRKEKEWTTFKLMADGFPNLIFQYNSAFQDIDNENVFYPSLILNGHTSNTRTVLSRRNFGVCGIAFYPFAISYLFGIPTNCFSNQVLDGSYILKKYLSETADKITKGPAMKERIQTFTSFLMPQLNRIKGRDLLLEQAVHQIINQQGILSIQALSNVIGLSRRQLERKFDVLVGFTPKYYSRIIRFQSTLQHSDASITNIAFSYGFADQAHFIREFHEFSGMTPKHYFKAAAETAENFMEIQKK